MSLEKLIDSVVPPIGITYDCRNQNWADWLVTPCKCFNKVKVRLRTSVSDIRNHISIRQKCV